MTNWESKLERVFDKEGSTTLSRDNSTKNDQKRFFITITSKNLEPIVSYYPTEESARAAYSRYADEEAGA